MQQKKSTMRKTKCCHWHSKRLNHTIIKNSATSAKRSFMMLMIALMIEMMILMVRNLMSAGFMVIPKDVMVLVMITMVMMMTAMMKHESFVVVLRDLMILVIIDMTMIIAIMNFTPESFNVMLMILIFMMIRNSMVWNFMVSAKVIKESVTIVIIQENTARLHTASVI